jgi:hypothetical protein
MEHCDSHEQLIVDLATIKTDIAYIKDRVCSHIAQGEEKGGFRDRLIIAEQAIAALRTSTWKVGMTAGFMGALIGNVAPEAIKLIATWLVGH